MTPRAPRLLLLTVAVGLCLGGIFAFMLGRFQAELLQEIRRTIIGRDAAVLYPVVKRQIADLPGNVDRAGQLLPVVLGNARQEGVLAVSVYNERGDFVQAVPATLILAELPAEDYVALLGREPISRYHPGFPLDRYFAGAAPSGTAPVLEVLLPLDEPKTGRSIGFAQYYLDARSLTRELDLVDGRLRRQTGLTLAAGLGLIALVLTGAYLAAARAQRAVDERNQRLARANFELTLSAKTAALGQLTSHLIHGLQGPIAGLRAVVPSGTPAAEYADRMQALISDVVGLLGDTRNGTTYQLTGEDLAASIRERSSSLAAGKRQVLTVASRLRQSVDGHRGTLLCLAANNLVQNAVAATAPAGLIGVVLDGDGTRVWVTVDDEGGGIPPEIQARLFEPGNSGRPGGTGLGLVISRLLTRQAMGDIELVRTGAGGTVFRAWIPTR